jgi:hypothetical protein
MVIITIPPAKSPNMQKKAAANPRDKHCPITMKTLGPGTSERNVNAATYANQTERLITNSSMRLT